MARPPSRLGLAPVPLAIAVVATGVAALAPAAPRHVAAQAAGGDLGEVDFPVSCADPVRPAFERGMALLHHMMYGQAEGVFREVAEEDPACAMAHWGVAMTKLHPLWAPPTGAELEEGLAAVKRARSLGGATPREEAYIGAIAAFFETPGDFSTRLRAWESGQRRVREAHPDDIDAAALHALALLATTPKDDPELSRRKRAGELLEELLARAPEHPGLFHYTIHAYDHPALADRAVEVARAYDQLAPEVPHALHMPSHIFVRLGMWPEVVDWNRRSAAAALRQSGPDATSIHYAHAMDYLAYAYLQTGRDDDARRVLGELRENGPHRPDVATAYPLAAIPARIALERHAWEDAAGLRPRVPEDYPWGDYPQAESMTHFARGLGAARSGDPEAARTSAARLEELRARLATAGPYWIASTRAQKTAVEAWIAREDGDPEEGLRLMRRAADVEDGVDKHPVTPGAVLPGRELLGEMLLLEGRPGEARAAFEAALEVSPNRLNALSGAARAAELAGDDDAARRYYARARDLLADDAAGIPRLDRIRASGDGGGS